MGVCELCQVTRTRPRVELAEEDVIARRAFRLTHSTLRVIEVAKHDRLRRTNCLARREYLAVSQWTILALGGDAAPNDSLQAVIALLHHAAHANRDFWIPLRVQARLISHVG